MNAATLTRIENALKTLSVPGINFNAEFEVDGFWSVQEDAGPAVKNWDFYLKRIELGHDNYRLIPIEDVSLFHLGQSTPKIEKTIDYYLVELPEGESFSISHHVDLGIDDGFIIGTLELVPDYLFATLSEEK